MPRRSRRSSRRESRLWHTLACCRKRCEKKVATGSRGVRNQVEALLADAHAVEKAGAFSVVLEIVVAEVAKQITNAIGIPTIGIGSGEHCDGQILVTHDLIGLFPWFTPKFVSPEARVAEEIRRAARAFIERTRGTAG